MIVTSFEHYWNAVKPKLIAGRNNLIKLSLFMSKMDQTNQKQNINFKLNCVMLSLKAHSNSMFCNLSMLVGGVYASKLHQFWVIFGFRWRCCTFIFIRRDSEKCLFNIKTVINLPISVVPPCWAFIAILASASLKTRDAAAAPVIVAQFKIYYQQARKIKCY